MPLIIYLDTQDYINIFNEPEDGPNHQVLHALLEHRERGDIAIGFSFITVMEFITKPDMANRQERVRRGELIKYICGPNAFPNLPDLGRGASFPNSGRWLYAKETKLISAQAFRRQLQKGMSEKISSFENLNRKARRKLRKKDASLHLLCEAASSWRKGHLDFGNFPVSKEIRESSIFERFVAGKCSDLEFERTLHSWLSDPAEFSKIFHDYLEYPNVIEQFFGSPIDNIEKLIDDLQNILRKLEAHNQDVLKMRATLIESGIHKSKARRLLKTASLPAFGFEKVSEKIGAHVGEKRAGHFAHYLKLATRPGYKFTRSDIMDLFQLCYAYDCDLFRCDRKMAGIFRDFAPLEGKLVSKFGDLPDRISTLLQKKA